MTMYVTSIPSSVLQYLLVQSEEEAMGLFQREKSCGTDHYSMVNNDESEHVDFGGAETNGIQD
eukprot:CAMPEP_0201932490 /NCGR_PEP_ID=MMETSP0903-20130614/29625_1 /ASSEMBLY_ACC=CAM_ASM_000552 /TAXON_ID=420261 /ORGANISM="Thalassiosira antarctica, Strain CCMP982" /LENGTH=62 /DNA_ID=CAMNT_0048472133 /DNA_START=41 /DNA_END=226 /DNA_ORIENTATION=+